jgi:hypothetical protein
MDHDRIVRRALWASVFFNAGGALLFAFPETIGSLVGLPAPVPRLYSVTLAFFVLLFGGTYLWLALQPRLDRPLVGFAAIGKAGFFVVALACWLAGEASGLGVVGAAGDLALASVFAWWLVSTRV